MANCSLLFGAWIAASRIIDNKHTLVDISAGAIIGSVIAFVVYLLYFEAPWGKYAGKPKLCA